MNNYIFDKIDNAIKENNITDVELKEFVTKLRELDNRYKNETQNRLEIIGLIRDNIYILEKKCKLLSPILFELESFYAYRDKYIDNYDKVMHLILNLANEKEDNYVLKQVFATEAYDPNDKDDTWYGKTLVIFDKRLSTALNKYTYRSNVLGRIIKTIIEYGYSVVMITQNFCDGKVRPKESMFDDISYKKIRNGGFAGDISCYLYDDELNNVINNILNYIEEYGPDFSNIDLDTLTKMISDYSKEKKLIK